MLDISTYYEEIALVIYLVLAIYTFLMAYMTLHSRKVMRAAIYLMLMLIGNATLYVFLGAEFLFVVQITVYAGGIMILFMFAVLLTGQEEQGIDREFLKDNAYKIFVFFLLVFTLFNMIRVGANGYPWELSKPILKNTLLTRGSEGTTELIKAFAKGFYHEFRFLVFFVGIVLTTAILGAVKIVIREEDL